MAAVMLLAEEVGAGADEPIDVIGTVLGRSDDFLSLVAKIGDVCVNNEICLAFLTVTFMGLGVRLLRRVIGAFGRGR